MVILAIAFTATFLRRVTYSNPHMDRPIGRSSSTHIDGGRVGVVDDGCRISLIQAPLDQRVDQVP